MGENAKSVSHLKQISNVLYSYASDHNGCVPARIEQMRQPDGTIISGLAWHSRLLADGYVKDKTLFFNPKEKYKTWNQWVDDPSIAANLKQPYASWQPVYGYRGDNWPNSQGNTIYRLANISHPSQFFIMVESWLVPNGYPGYFVTATGTDWRVKMDEKGISNTLFADGHVEPKTREYFLNLPNTPSEVTGGGFYRFWPETR